MIGVVAYEPQAVFQRDVIAGIEDICAMHGYPVTVAAVRQPQSPDFPLDMAGLRGLLVVASALDNDLLRRLAHARLPMTLISHQLPDTPLPAIAFNNDQGVRKLFHHLYHDCGRRTLVYIRGMAMQADARAREDTLQRELLRHNLLIPDTHILRGDFDAGIAADSLTAFLETDLHFDALISADYLMGCAALDVLRGAGVAVPDTVSVVGFGDGIEAETAGLTTVAADVKELGRRAARQLLGQIQGMRISGTTLLSTRLIVRESSC